MKMVINIAHQKSCPQYFVLLIPLNKKKIITSNKLNMGFQICSKFGSLINSQSLNYCWSDSTSKWHERDKRKRRWREGWERLFLIFPSKGGDYSREVINQATAIIQGNTVCIFIAHVSGLQEQENDKPWFDFFFVGCRFENRWIKFYWWDRASK